MATNTQQVLSIIEALVPPIMAFVREHVRVNGQPPTDTEALEWLHQHADGVIAKGEAWLKQHPPAGLAPVSHAKTS